MERERIRSSWRADIGAPLVRYSVICASPGSGLVLFFVSPLHFILRGRLRCNQDALRVRRLVVSCDCDYRHGNAAFGRPPRAILRAQPGFAMSPSSPSGRRDGRIHSSHMLLVVPHLFQHLHRLLLAVWYLMLLPSRRTWRSYKRRGCRKQGGAALL